MPNVFTRRTGLQLVAGAGAGLFASPARAQWGPNRPVTLIVPWAPGGSTDILARVVAEQLRTPLGQPVVVENRSGASGNTGSDLVAKARPDGHTILFGSMSTHAMNHALFPSMPFDGVRDFTPIARLAFVTNTMVIHPSVPADNVQGFIDYLKARPGEVPYASAGQGSTNHLCGALFEHMTGTRMIHVPYRGGAPAVTDTVGGRTMMFVTASTQSLPHVRAGRLKMLAVTEGRRSPLLPEVPTVAETVPGYEMAVWYGAFGPAGLPAEITERFNTEINRALMLPAVRQRMADIGVEVVNETPQVFAQALEADAARWGRIIRELGIQGE